MIFVNFTAIFDNPEIKRQKYVCHFDYNKVSETKRKTKIEL